MRGEEGQAGQLAALTGQDPLPESGPVGQERVVGLGVEDVDGFVDAKLAALHRHTSQMLSTMHVDEGADATTVTAQRQAFDDRIRDQLGRAGASEGRAVGEAFKLIDDL